MARDVRMFVQGCSDCTVSKSPRHLPSGKLLPLPVPNRPWLHLGVEFITDLPASDGKTCVLVFIKRFSKSCRLLPPNGLPTAIETAMFNNIFHYYGIPEDIFSDRGPQLISKAWKDFFTLLGVTVSLSSGYSHSRIGMRRGRSRKLCASSELSAMAARTLGTSS